MNLDVNLQEHARQRPEKVAIGWEAGTLTYRELNQRVHQMANHFLTSGIVKGDRIAIILDNSPEFVISYYACMRIGAISVPINPAFTAREFGVIINDSTPKIIVTTKHIYGILQRTDIEGELQYVFIYEQSFDESSTNRQAMHVTTLQDNDACSILYTSGTTGAPKGAVLTYQNLYHNAKTFAEALQLDAEDRTLILTPLSHIAAQSNCMNTMIFCGGYMYLIPRWESSTHTLSTLEKEEITFFFGPPTVYTYMLNDSNIQMYDLQLKIAYTGAAPLPEQVFQQWAKTFGFEIVEGYGMTECSPVISVNPPYGLKKIGSVGVPIKDVQVKLVNEQHEEVRIGEPGELLVKGPNVLKEYYKRPEDTQNAFIDGWFRTGDIAKKDGDGYLYIVDRQKDIIIRSGFNIYPREVEEVLYEHPAVLEAAVIGYPDAEKGELVKAILTLKSGYTMQALDLKAFCKERLATYKVPQEFEVVGELPKTTSGKIVKAKLRELYVQK